MMSDHTSTTSSLDVQRHPLFVPYGNNNVSSPFFLPHDLSRMDLFSIPCRSLQVRLRTQPRRPRPAAKHSFIMATSYQQLALDTFCAGDLTSLQDVENHRALGRDALIRRSTESAVTRTLVRPGDFDSGGIAFGSRCNKAYAEKIRYLLEMRWGM